ncbi:MAG: HAD family phosphatase [Atopobium sp.]|uniref:HAD family hydrolase n=1 Tax=Atopobium sp. TaxID=1872650 RepID=UPI002A74BC79|nr:HAD family phosphatase [Atopobium sp.]MDY2788861.1 HAD family phosphatase [Atopobium sp.]
MTSFAPVRAVLFDMDGVLIDSESFYNQRRATFLKSVGRASQAHIDFSGCNDKTIWETLVPEDAKLRDALHTQYDAYRIAHPVDCVSRSNPQAPELFKTLHARGVLTAICSSSELSMIQEYMHAQKVAPLIDFVISGHQCAHHKPYPDIYLSAMKALGVQPQQCLVVEDSPIGIRAGLASGARVVALSQYSAGHLDQSEAHEIVDHLHDILSFIDL